MERKKGQRYSSEFRRQAVERINACDNIIALARELGVGRRLLYVWRDRFGETDPPPQRSRELILRKQIRKLKRLLANKTLEAVWLASLSSGQVQAPSYQNNFRAGETAARCHW